jgi:hypothetical protein|tara:strand:+ start:1273 stop:1479 length:207 start_codon:yes stop_codon:yes gene_type:complete
MNNADKPAMPSPHFEDDELQGLTKREHFAGLAMQALLTHHGNEGYVPCAAFAVEFADALLKELEQDND